MGSPPKSSSQLTDELLKEATPLQQLMLKNLATLNDLLMQNQKAPGDGTKMLKSVDWKELAVLCPDRLDVDSFTPSKQKAWERQFRSFVESQKLQERVWATTLTALESRMTHTTFERVNALRLQQIKDIQENLDAVLKLATSLIDGTKSKWIHRNEFYKIKQVQGQSIRSFLAECISKSTDCQFGDGYCEACMVMAVEDQVVQKLVCCTISEEARKELLRQKSISVEAAATILEAHEAANKVEQELTDDNHRIKKMMSRASSWRGRSHGRGQPPPRKEYSSSQPPAGELCSRCGRDQHRNSQKCPAIGSKCQECGRTNHWAAVCRSKAKPDHNNNQKPKVKKMGRIRRILSTTENTKASVVIHGVQVKAEPDTGSDWDCASLDALFQLGEFRENLLRPTPDMVATENASGERMDCFGYIKTEVKFGEQTSKINLVIFDGLDGIVLSRDAVTSLGIVKIQLSPIKSKKEVKVTKTETRLSTSPSQQSVQSLFKKAPELVTEQDVKTVFSDVFGPRPDGMLGEKFKIHLKEDYTPCQVTSCRHVPLHKKAGFKKALDSLESQGIITKCSQPTEWVHPVVLADKKNSDEPRICLDTRRLNQNIRREHYPCTTVQDALDTVIAEKAQIYTMADAYKGYNQCELDESSKDLTCFITPFGRYRYNRAPMGICSISEHFERRMSEHLEGLQGLARVVDDNLIYGRDHEEHLTNVVNFLIRCREKKIRLNADKFVFAKQEVKFAGVVVKKEEYHVDPEAVSAIRDFPEPKSLTAMQSFQGKMNLLAPYDPQLAKKFDPLRHLLKKGNTKIQMTPDESKAFEDVKERLVEAPTNIAFFRPGEPIQVFTDAACITGFGFVVKQKQPDNTWKPIMVGSRALIDAEKRYAPIESELTALAWSLRKARKFLLGAPQFTVYTDHRPLVTICNKRRLDEVANTRILRNLLKIQDFNFDVVYIEGKKNLVADALSRHPVGKPEPLDVEEAHVTMRFVRNIRMNSMDAAQLSLPMAELQTEAESDLVYQDLMRTIVLGFPESKLDLDNALAEYWNGREHLSVADDDFILYGTRLLIPKKLRRKMLDLIHLGHRGIKGCQSRARLSVYWPGIDRQIEQVCQSCEQCQYDRPTQTEEPQIHLPTPSRNFQYQSADFAETNGRHFLIVTDWRSGWFSVRPMKTTNASSTIKELREIFMDTAVPEYLYTDNGPPFSSAELQQFLANWGVRWASSSPYHAQSNTFAENGVKQAKALLTKCASARTLDHDSWTRGMLNIRNTPHANGLSPAIMVYGHQVSELLPAHKSALAKSWHKQLHDVDTKIAENRQKAEKYRPGKKLSPILEGKPVLIQNRTTKKWDRIGIVQESDAKIRKYLVRLPSGLTTVRNRRDLRIRYPPENVPTGGTESWEPFPKPVTPPISSIGKPNPTVRFETPTMPVPVLRTPVPVLRTPVPVLRTPNPVLRTPNPGTESLEPAGSRSQFGKPPKLEPVSPPQYRDTPPNSPPQLEPAVTPPPTRAEGLAKPEPSKRAQKSNQTETQPSRSSSRTGRQPDRLVIKW